jgi:hypothetical protein
MLIGGPAAVYRTVFHVETFVEQHYNEQGLKRKPTLNPFESWVMACPSVVALPTLTAVEWMTREAAAQGGGSDAVALHNMTRVLSACCADEVHHMREAEAATPQPSAAAATGGVRVCVLA